MTWIEHHRRSERHASQAEQYTRQGSHGAARRAYQLAADAEEQALQDLDLAKSRTYGVTVVSAVSLRYKAAEFRAARLLAYNHLAMERLPIFAESQLSDILQAITNELVREGIGVSLDTNKLNFSLRGHDILEGAAPMSLIVAIAQRAEALFHRVAEFTRDIPHRSRGLPSKDIRESYQPWLVQAEPGSFQFAIALQGPAQGNMFPTGLSTSEVADKAFSILQAGVHSPSHTLVELVPDGTYRRTFLSVARDLSPTRGRRLEIRSGDSNRKITLDQWTRDALNDAIQRIAQSGRESSGRDEQLKGILRGVDLERDWLEVVADSKPVRVHGVGATIDDLIGPMVNHHVIVTAAQGHDGVFHFRDIEPAE